MIIGFMKAKQSKLTEMEIKKPQYFTKKDEEAIRQWESDKAEGIWKEIVKYIKELGVSGLFYYECPFCIKHSHFEYIPGRSYPLYFFITYGNLPDCHKCEYGKHHEVCSKRGSDYFKILQKFHREYGKDADIGKYFTNDFYKSVVDKLEKLNGGE